MAVVQWCGGHFARGDRSGGGEGREGVGPVKVNVTKSVYR